MKRLVLVAAVIVGIVLVGVLGLMFKPPPELGGGGGIPGVLLIRFSPEVMLENTPNETKERIVQFINLSDLEMNIIGYSDENVFTFVNILRKNMSENFIASIENDPLVKKFERYEKAVYTKFYLIEFKEGMYGIMVMEFADRHPEIKDELYHTVASLSNLPIHVTVAVPVGSEDEYIIELETKYPNEISDVLREYYE